MKREEIAGYRWANNALTPSHGYLLPALLRELGALPLSNSGVGGESKRVFDLVVGMGVWRRSSLNGAGT
jgi:hypothetical protein